MTALAPAVESFFTGYLIAQRGASPHTIASYRDTFRLLFAWIHEQSGIRPSALDFTDLDAATVSHFLAMLEEERHNTAPDPQSAARGDPLPVPPRRSRPPRARRPHRPRPGHPAAQEGRRDGRLADRGRGRGPPGHPRPRHLDRPPRPRADPRHAHQRPASLRGHRLTWADIILDRPGARVLWHGKGRKEGCACSTRPPSRGCGSGTARTPPASAFVFTARGTTGR